MKGVINVVSAFDGMGCLYIALKEAGIKVNKYFAIETDKFAIQQTKHNFPDIIHLGDINNVTTEDFRGFNIDLFAGGSPCQGFSFAGAGLNFDDPRSALFFEYIRILKELREVNPDIKFLLENVNMKREHLGVISKYLEIYPVRINSNLVSAQNRDRFYWTNIKTRKEGLFDELWSDIPQPKDRGILLKDVLQPESEIDDKYYISNAVIDRMNRKEYSKPKINPDKTGSLNTKNNSGQSSLDSGTTFIGIDTSGKAPTQRNSTGRCLDKKHNYQIIGVVKENLIMTKNYVQWDVSGKGYKSQQDRAFYEDGKHGTLSAAKGENKNGVLTKDFKLRRLTPTECARLQTIPDWYKWIVSDTQVYRMLGNGWTVEVIKHILLF